MRHLFLTAIITLLPFISSGHEARMSNYDNDNSTPSVSELRSMLDGAMIQFMFSNGITQENKDKTLNALDQIDKANLEILSDTVKYYYYVLTTLSKDDLPLSEKQELMEKAVFLRENIVGILDVEYVFCQVQLAILYSQEGYHDKGIMCLEKALSIAQSLNLHSDFNFARRNLLYSLHNLCYWGLAGNYEEKEDYLPAMSCYFIAFNTNSSITGTVDNDFSILCLECSFKAMLKVEDRYNIKEYPEFILDLLKQYNATRTRAYAIAQGYKALIDGANQESINSLNQSINHLKSFNDNDENLDIFYKTLCTFYSQLDRKEELEGILPQVKEYFDRTGNAANYEELIEGLNK